MRESWPTDTLKGLDASALFISSNHAEKAAAIASVTGSVRVTGSPSTPATATPRISLCSHYEIIQTQDPSSTTSN